MATPHLADEQNQGRGALVGGVDPYRGVGGTRAAGHEADAGSSGEPGPSFGHVGRAAFVATGHEPEAVPDVVKSVQHGQVALTWHPEGRVDALGQQAVDQ